jgi:Tetratricopeptide repeat
VTGIALPDEDRLPPGPHRDLLEALHSLYEGAGKPGLRRIAAGITDADYRDTVSHEKIGALLRGAGLPGCLKVECVVRQLAAWHNPRLNPDEEAARFTALWLAADRVRRAGEAHPAAAPASPPPAGDPVGLAVGMTAEGTPSRVPGEAGLSSKVRGRDELIGRLSRGLDPQHGPGRPQVLVGAAGIGKSTIAYTAAGLARRVSPQRRAWWVCAADEERLSGDLADVARDLGVGEADWARLGTRPVADLSEVADRVWERLERERPGWLLVIDNADDPGLLGPQDGTGWIRRTVRGLVLITSRDGDGASWPGSGLIRVGPLRSEDAAQVLTDFAPAAGDRIAARALAQRLGYVPLALRLAGMYLRQDFGSGRTFDEYRQALDHADTPELSLDALGRAGFPQARPLLWLLACYAPSSLIPEEIITGGLTPVWPGGGPASGGPALAGLLDADQALPVTQLADYCRTGLGELQSAGLVDRSRSDDGRKVIRVHASIAEAARAVMDHGPVAAGRPDPALVRASAAAAACAFAAALDTGSAEHWPYFRVLTPHVEELLLHTAGHLPRRARRDLLTCMVRCIAAHIWSKAERRAEQLSLRSMTLAADLGCHDQDGYLSLRHVHAWARREQGWLTEAAEEFQDVLARQLRTEDGATRLDTLRTRQQLAWTLGRLGRWAEAEAGLREVIRLLDDRRRQRGTEGHDARVLRLHARCMTNWCVGRQGRWAEAEQGYRQLVTDREEVLGPDHPDTLDARFDIGKALAWQGKWAAAENEWRHTASDRAQALGEHHPDTLVTRQLQLYAGGYQAWQSGDSRGRRIAVAGLEMVLSTQREKRGDDHRETIETRALLAALGGDYSPSMTWWPEDLPRPGAD